ncbi:SoxR reducing system RseC family protein [Wansuia hejianensis]|uniref:SoxR reducing system RseC family protein n=1 Tax=Wansuia hejianensis TaxID=2763667 RepID=A0A926EWV2_9FIRM|nr:SoxR reducing system RseC family protein [Wansuia hejianensis]MBC8590426.1 SoxR reducing system RseC family protein [Wansuia hejianensis]
MDQIGFVRKANGENIELEVRRVSGCGGGCSTCSSNCEVAPHIVTLPNELNAKVGDFVEIKGNTKNILKYTFIVYMVPFVLFIIGIVLGNMVFKDMGISSYEILSFLMGVVFLGLSFIVVKLIDKRIEKKRETSISVVRIL